MAVAGSVESVTIRGREFPVAADADTTRKLGGYENAVNPFGGGSSNIVKARMSPMFGGLVVQCDDVRRDHEFLQDIADGNEFVDVLVTYASGISYEGEATIVGELQYSSQAGIASFDLAGQGRFTPQ